MNLRQLRYFVKVVETGNITRASESMNVAQTALGQQIRHLEESLGVRLLVRHSRGISLTEPGELLHRHALAILGSVEEARREVMARGAARREVVNLGVTPSIQALIGPELLLAAREEIPEISFRVVEELSFILIDALLRGELDIAFAYEFQNRPGLAATALIEEELLFVAGAGSRVLGDSIPFEDAIRTDLALVSDRDIVWRLIHDAAGRQGLPVNVAFEVQSMPAIKTLVARGAATSVVPYGVVAEEIQQGLIVACPIRQPSMRRTLFLNRMSDAPSFIHEAALLALLDRMIGRLAERMGPYGNVIGRVLPRRHEEAQP
ncbi:LysR family transcriptional regulator [Sinorhizobium psoraleae]|uniref:LysR substrate-binding domain-containing protein n=1 Tax=Sinorhizobium psoraleae TaxID=520838 RepID=A0ABT4KJ89_9HYPH|nr:LysR substrate-binding domain-containing protein [Sinorhizobium psoraleae]MCZ4092032.1 LysR substrate-binding domain-containing protein [Sinorhizobium psoraleae]